MSDSNNPAFPDFGKLVPGFDFLQNLTRQAGSAAKAIPAMPSLGNWVAPTLNVEELDKRIQELKAVQFWLDQNATALKATIQALEVQKMTLATLKSMNVSMNEMAEAFSIKPASAEPAKAHSFAGLEVPDTSYQKKSQADKTQTADEADDAAPDTNQTATVPGVIDPLQWWGALTQQFQTIANSAMKEVSARSPAAGLEQGLAQGMKAAGDMAEQASRRMAESVGGATELMSNALATPAWPAAGKTAPRKSGSRAAAPAGKTSAAGARRKTTSAGAAKTAKTTASTSAKTGSTARAVGAKAPSASATRKGTARSR